MKSPWPVVFVVAGIAILRMADVKSDESGKALPASDPMPGKVPGDVRDDNGLKMKLAWCPPGMFRMENIELVMEPAAEKDEGSNDDEDVDEPKGELAPEPRRTERITTVKVFLSQGYWLGKYEVTQSEWKQVMKTEPWNGQKLTKDGDDFPATFVSWGDASDFCRELTARERQAGRLSNEWEYTLPTEAQWERACRARTETKFNFGDDESKLADFAWIIGNTWTAGERFAHRVGQKKPNAWGFCDMHGNIWEWCRDHHVEKLPGGRDPEVQPDWDVYDPDRVVRGGSWRFHAPYCHSGFRWAEANLRRYEALGFRVALCRVRQIKPAAP